MKKTLISITFALFAVFVFNTQTVRAHGDSLHTESIETVLQAILNQQKVSTIQRLDLSKISDDDWERLGDAVMELQHPGQAHEVMDQMMGGEGSDSLKAMHIYMGQRYLDCSSDLGMMGGTSGMTGGMMGGNMMGMMGGGMMNNLLTNPSANYSDGNWSYSMMGFPTTAGFGSGWMIFGWLFMVWDSFFGFRFTP